MKGKIKLSLIFILGITFSIGVIFFIILIGKTQSSAIENEIKQLEEITLYNKKLQETNIIPQQSNEPSTEPKKETITINAVGDILLTRGPATMVKSNGFDYLFKEIVNELSNTDITFANLECPVSFLGTPYYGKPKNVTFRADPSMLFGLKYAGIDIVSLANNHINDYYSKALDETMNLLKIIDIKYSGTGKNIAEARIPSIIEVKGYKLAFLSYAEEMWSVIEATEKNSGTVYINEKTITEDITNTKKNYNPNYIFVSLHWGVELSHNPRKSDIEIAHKIIDAGADFVFGHHPHVLQGIEIYKGKVILYSLGNFVFDMKDIATYRSMIFNISIDNDGIKEAKIIPVSIIQKKYYPTIATGKEAETILKKISEYSKQFGTIIEVSNEYGKIIFEK